jgi:DNA-binding SARP family transcriptional activator
VLLGEGTGLVAAMERAAADAADDHPDAAGRLLLDVVILKLYAGHLDALALARRAHALTSTADAATRARADTVVGIACVFAGETEDAQTALGKGLELVRVGGAPDEVAYLVQQVVVGLASTEQYTAAVGLCRRYVRAVRSVGADGLLPLLLCYLANSAYFTSDLDEMEMAATEATGLAAASGQDSMAAYATACRGVVGALRGDPDATAVLEQGRAGLVAAGAGVIRMLPTMGLALAAMGAGDWAGAVARFGELRELFGEAVPVAGVLHWRADEVEALWRAGRRDEARARLAELVETAPTGPWERAAMARASGLVGAEDPEASYLAALAEHEGSPSAFERARTELCFGEWLLGQGRRREAEDRLRAAAAAFTALDTHPWAARAQGLLATAPGGTAIVETRPPEEAECPAHVEIRAFGPLTVVRDGVETRVGLGRPGRVLRSLVAAGGALHTDQLIDMLWPDATRENGAERLRTVLARVRRSYGSVVTRDGSVLRWADEVETDVDRFEVLARQALMQRHQPDAIPQALEAVGLYHDDLLPLEREAADVALARDRLRRRYLDLLDLLADEEIERGRPAAAVVHLRAAIDRDPLDEGRHIRLARLLADQGQHGRAREAVEHALHSIRELGLPTPAELARLQRELRVGTAGS